MEAREQGYSYDMKKKLHKEGQDYLMAGYILKGSELDSKKQFNGANIINAMVDANTVEEKHKIFSDWWLDYHWAGHKQDPKLREEKEKWLKDRMKSYKRNKDWADNTGPNSIFNEFNMDNFS